LCESVSKAHPQITGGLVLPDECRILIQRLPYIQSRSLAACFNCMVSVMNVEGRMRSWTLFLNRAHLDSSPLLTNFVYSVRQCMIHYVLMSLLMACRELWQLFQRYASSTGVLIQPQIRKALNSIELYPTRSQGTLLLSFLPLVVLLLLLHPVNIKVGGRLFPSLFGSLRKCSGVGGPREGRTLRSLLLFG
jgi:hypothetical protein